MRYVDPIDGHGDKKVMREIGRILEGSEKLLPNSTLWKTDCNTITQNL
ncbi:MAG: hypothetical protein QXR19_04725 [Candidatus Jordarchaeaceae archaeon]